MVLGRKYNILLRHDFAACRNFQRCRTLSAMRSAGDQSILKAYVPSRAVGVFEAGLLFATAFLFLR